MYFSKFNVKKNFEKFSKSYNTLLELSPAKGTKPVKAKPNGALGKTNLLRSVSVANSIQSWAH